MVMPPASTEADPMLRSIAEPDPSVQPAACAGTAATSQQQDLQAVLARTHALASLAFQALGMTAGDAAQAASDGGMVLNGRLVTVAPLPVSALTGRATDDALMLTVDTGLRLEKLPTEGVAALLAHGPGLLAAYGAGLGCQPDGTLVVHRRLSTHQTTGAGLADDILATRRLVQMLRAGQGNARQQ
jgi:hypothetical protein